MVLRKPHLYIHSLVYRRAHGVNDIERSNVFLLDTLIPYHASHLTNRCSQPLARHGKSATSNDFMRRLSILANLAGVYPPRRASGS